MLKIAGMMVAFALLCVMAMVQRSDAAPEMTPYYTTSSGWQVLYHTSTGNCVMIRTHSMGTQVIVNFERSNSSWTFSLSNPTWDLVRSGEKYHLLLTFEDGSKWEGNFVGAIFNGRPLVSLPSTNLEFIKSFMAHDKMTIRTNKDGSGTTVNLDGSWDAMLQVAACQKAHQS